MFTYKRFTQGLLGSNTYVLWDEDTLECALIDAGNPTELVWPFLEEKGLPLLGFDLDSGSPTAWDT